MRQPTPLAGGLAARCSILTAIVFKAGSTLGKVLVVVIFLGILVSMGSALVFLVKDRGQSDRTVKALTVRIVISVALFALLFVLWAMGLISPHGVQP
jgi:hypothetical protein